MWLRRWSAILRSALAPWVESVSAVAFSYRRNWRRIASTIAGWLFLLRVPTKLSNARLSNSWSSLLSSSSTWVCLVKTVVEMFRSRCRVLDCVSSCCGRSILVLPCRAVVVVRFRDGEGREVWVVGSGCEVHV